MFDARSMKLLAPGQHLTSPDYPGLRFEATDSTRTWVYRYRRMVDNRLRQIKIGNWPAMSLHAAVVEWEQLRRARDEGGDPAEDRKRQRTAAKEAVLAERGPKVAPPTGAYTVLDVCTDYWAGHIRGARKQKGADEVWRTFDTMLGEFASLVAADVTRTQAFELIQSFSHIPVQASNLRAELGGAWDYALDAGKLPDTTPNWWRMILRGKLKSKGKKIQGLHIGTVKRVLTPQEAGEVIRWLPNFTCLIDDVLTLYLWTAARGAEIVQMEGREIVLESGVWWWEQSKLKTKNARHERATDLRLPLFGRALAIVQRRKALYGDGWLFRAKLPGGRVEPVKQKTIQTTVYYHQPYSMTYPHKLRSRLTVSHWAPHDLRRTARTFLAALGCPREVAETIIGHMLPGMEGIYNKYTYDAEKVVWLKRLSDHLESLAACQAAAS